MAKVAIIGGGSAGMGAAIALAKAGMDVSLFETEPRLGGHCFSVAVALWDRRTIQVDAGVSEFNQTLSDHLYELMSELNLACYPANPDFSFMTPSRATVWFSRDGAPQFPQPLAERQSFLDQIKRFNETCFEVLDDATYADWSVQRYLDARQYSQLFRRIYFDPQARGCFAMFERPADSCLIRNIVATWRMLGLVGAAERKVVQGGMHVYCNATEKWLRERRVPVHLSTRVVRINRLGGGVKLRACDRERSDLTFWFDHVVVATGAHQVTALLEDAVDDEMRIYAEFPTEPVRLVVHQDATLLPTDRATWGAYNYIVADGDGEAPATVTLYANRLQNLPASIPDVFSTLNPIREPHKDKIIAQRTFSLPFAGSDAVQKLDAIQGKRRTWFCGSYLRQPFAHEQAYRCGLEIAQRLIEAVADESLQFESGAAVSVGGFDSFLREIPLIADLDPRALSEVQLAARPFQFEAGTTLFKQGDPSDGLYIIKHGEIDIVRRLPGDRLVHLAHLGHGAIVGEMSLLDQNPRSTNAVAVSATSGYFISLERFRILQSDFRPAAFAVMNCFRREAAARARNRIGEVAALIASSGPPCATEDKPKRPAPTTAAIDEALLRSLPFFRTLRIADLRAFVASLKRFDFSPGELLYAAGEPAQSCLIIVRGAVSIGLPGDGLAMFAIRGPGQMVGELALMDGGQQPFDCKAREPTIAFEVDRIQFEGYRRGGSVLALRFFEGVTSSMIATLRKADAHFARLVAERRLASIVSSPVHLSGQGDAPDVSSPDVQRRSGSSR